MSTCSKCGSPDRNDLFYGICSLCRKRILNSIPLIDWNKVDIPPIDSTMTNQTIPDQKLIIKILNNFVKNTLGILSLFFDLIALIMIIIFLNTLLYAGAFSISAIICGILELALDWDENWKYIGYGFLIGVILSVISLWPLILVIVNIFF
ncbi:hypothetical protein LCGC14_2951480 [marine sediment metagenome]|uniref:Uncharacterized protein n=1 Tax=marine sediment metagenome TaxID=412755 RepID=A0A0F9A6A4_9ZZZZ